MNNTDHLFQTLIAATSQAARELQFQKKFLESIYWGTRPIAATPYTTVNVVVPTVNQANTVDIGGGPIQPHDLAHSSYPVTLDRHLSNSFVVPTWDQGRTPLDLRTLYVDAELEGFGRQINDVIASMATAANFPNYSVIQGSGSDSFNRADFTAAWANLAKAGVPGLEKTHLITSVDAYANMLADPNFINQYIVGDSRAADAQGNAKVRSLYGFSVDYDQQLQPYEAGKEPAILFHPYAFAGVWRQPTPLDAGGVKETTLNVFNVPIQMQVQASVKDQGWIIHYHAWLGVAPARTEMATLLQTA